MIADSVPLAADGGIQPGSVQMTVDAVAHAVARQNVRKPASNSMRGG